MKIKPIAEEQTTRVAITKEQQEAVRYTLDAVQEYRKTRQLPAYLEPVRGHIEAFAENFDRAEREEDWMCFS